MEKDISQKYNAFRTVKGNIVWGGALSLAWRGLRQTFGLEQLQFKTENPHILALIKNFNQCPFSPNHISQASIYIKIGSGNETVKIINESVMKKFPTASIAKINFNLSAEDIIAYAYLSKSIAFKVKFNLREQKQFLFNGSPVTSFYAATQIQKKQIKCWQYQNEGNFTVHISDNEGVDELYLVKSSKELNVDQVIDHVARLEQKGQSVALRKEDKFQMPCVRLNCERILKQMKGLRFANNKLSCYMISVILERMKLSIDESGAKVENMGVIVATKAKALKKDPYKPKYIILDKTFWVVMKQSQKHPYFCAEIRDPNEEES